MRKKELKEHIRFLIEKIERLETWVVALVDNPDIEFPAFDMDEVKSILNDMKELTI